MTQLEQINQEKELLKKQIQESVSQINEIVEGTKMEINICTHYVESLNFVKLVKTDIDIKLTI